MDELAPSLKSSDPVTYVKLVENAETIIAAIIKVNNMQPEREPLFTMYLIKVHGSS